MAKIIIPTPLRKFTANEAFFESKGTTVGESITELTQLFPDLKQHLWDEQGQIRKFLKVYIGDEDITALDNELTKVDESTTISIIPAIAGGIL